MDQRLETPVKKCICIKIPILVIYYIIFQLNVAMTVAIGWSGLWRVYGPKRLGAVRSVSSIIISNIRYLVFIDKNNNNTHSALSRGGNNCSSISASRMSVDRRYSSSTDDDDGYIFTKFSCGTTIIINKIATYTSAVYNYAHLFIAPNAHHSTQFLRIATTSCVHRILTGRFDIFFSKQ